jgi:hypothetical protein
VLWKKLRTGAKKRRPLHEKAGASRSGQRTMWTPQLREDERRRGREVLQRLEDQTDLQVVELEGDVRKLLLAIHSSSNLATTMFSGVLACHDKRLLKY